MPVVDAHAARAPRADLTMSCFRDSNPREEEEDGNEDDDLIAVTQDVYAVENGLSSPADFPKYHARLAKYEAHTRRATEAAGHRRDYMVARANKEFESLKKFVEDRFLTERRILEQKIARVAAEQRHMQHTAAAKRRRLAASAAAAASHHRRSTRIAQSGHPFATAGHPPPHAHHHAHHPQQQQQQHYTTPTSARVGQKRPRSDAHAQATHSTAVSALSSLTSAAPARASASSSSSTPPPVTGLVSQFSLTPEPVYRSPFDALASASGVPYRSARVTRSKTKNRQFKTFSHILEDFEIREDIRAIRKRKVRTKGRRPSPYDYSVTSSPVVAPSSSSSINGRRVDLRGAHSRSATPAPRSTTVTPAPTPAPYNPSAAVTSSSSSVGAGAAAGGASTSSRDAERSMRGRRAPSPHGPPRIAIDARTESLTYLDESFAPGDKVRCFIVALRNGGGGGRHHGGGGGGAFPPSLLPPGVATRNGFHHASSLLLLPVNKHGKISCQFTGVVKRVSFKAACLELTCDNGSLFTCPLAHLREGTCQIIRDPPYRESIASSLAASKHKAAAAVALASSSSGAAAASGLPPHTLGSGASLSAAASTAGVASFVGRKRKHPAPAANSAGTAAASVNDFSPLPSNLNLPPPLALGSLGSVPSTLPAGQTSAISSAPLPIPTGGGVPVPRLPTPVPGITPLPPLKSLTGSAAGASLPPPPLPGVGVGTSSTSALPPPALMPLPLTSASLGVGTSADNMSTSLPQTHAGSLAVPSALNPHKRSRVLTPPPPPLNLHKVSLNGSSGALSAPGKPQLGVSTSSNVGSSAASGLLPPPRNGTYRDHFMPVGSRGGVPHAAQAPGTSNPSKLPSSLPLPSIPSHRAHPPLSASASISMLANAHALVTPGLFPPSVSQAAAAGAAASVAGGAMRGTSAALRQLPPHRLPSTPGALSNRLPLPASATAPAATVSPTSGAPPLPMPVTMPTGRHRHPMATHQQPPVSVVPPPPMSAPPPPKATARVSA